MNDRYEELRRTLIARRKTLGMTKTEVAARMGYTPSYMTGLERNYPRNPDPVIWRKWARALYCDLHFDAALTYERYPEPPRLFDVTPEIPKPEEDQ